MPQFDTFIFSSSLSYFIFFFLVTLFCNFTLFLPRLGALLKLRFKMLSKSAFKQEFSISLDNTKFSFYPLIIHNNKEG